MIADEKEIEFYSYFDISPIGILSNCQYDNEFRLGLEYGEDVCEHVDEDPDSYSCNTCIKHKQDTLYYPPITDDLIINLLLLCGTENLNVERYSTKQDKYSILEYIKQFKQSQSAYDLIRDLLIGHLQEWSRM